MNVFKTATVCLGLVGLCVLAAPALAADATPGAGAAPPPLPYGAPITLDQARIVAAAAEAEARRRHVAVSIAVVDSGGTLVLMQRMDGAALSSAETAPNKAKSAVYWQRPTSYWITGVSAGNAGPTTFPNVVVSNGGELLVAGGRIIGGLGVGGSGPNEVDLARMGVAALK